MITKIKPDMKNLNKLIYKKKSHYKKRHQNEIYSAESYLTLKKIGGLPWWRSG